MLTKSALAGLIALLFSSTPSARAQPTQQDFPDGPGKETFVSHCGGCHDHWIIPGTHRLPRAGALSSA